MRPAATAGLAGLLGTLLTILPGRLPAARAQDGDAKPAAEQAIPPVPPRDPPPPDPSTKIKKEIDASLRDFFDIDPDLAKEPLAAQVARAQAGAKLMAAITAWNGAIGQPEALRRVDWWKTHLAETFPTSNVSTAGKIAREEFTLNATKITVWVNLPKTYKSGSPLFPVILTVIDKGADAKKTLEAAYGDLLNTHVVVANTEECVLPFPAKMLFGLKYVFSKYRVDRERVVIDGLGKCSRFVEVLAADSPIYFNGAVFRSPGTVSPAVGNLALFPCAVVLPASVPDAVTEALGAMRGACPELKEFPAAEPPKAIQDWIAALPPRRIVDQKVSYTWYTRTTKRAAIIGDGLWFRISGWQDSGDDKIAMVRIHRDPAFNLVDLDCKWVSRLSLYLNDELLDLDHPVYVRVNGVLVHTERKPVRRAENAFHYLEGKFAGDLWPRQTLISSIVDVTIPEEAMLTREEQAAVQKAKEAAGGGGDPPPAPPGEGAPRDPPPPPAEAPPAPPAERPPEAPPAEKPPEKPPEAPPPGEVPPAPKPAEAAAEKPAETAPRPSISIFESPKEDAPLRAELRKALDHADVKKVLQGFRRIDKSVAAEGGVPLDGPPWTMVLPTDVPVLHAARADGMPLGRLSLHEVKPEAVTENLLRWLREMETALKAPSLAVILRKGDAEPGQKELLAALEDPGLAELVGKFVRFKVVVPEGRELSLASNPAISLRAKDAPALHALRPDGAVLGSLDARTLDAAKAKATLFAWLTRMEAEAKVAPAPVPAPTAPAPAAPSLVTPAPATPPVPASPPK